MSKFAKWATRSGYSPRSKIVSESKPSPAPLQPAQGATGGDVTLYTADGRPVVLSAQTPTQAPDGPRLVGVTRPDQIVHPRQVRPRTKKHAPECLLMKKDDHEGYTNLLHQLPDLVAAGHVQDQNPDSVDALKMVGIPEGAVMNKWSNNARYFNGATDSSEQVDGHLGDRYGESLASSRTGRSEVIRSERGSSNRID